MWVEHTLDTHVPAILPLYNSEIFTRVIVYHIVVHGNLLGRLTRLQLIARVIVPSGVV